jgi:hypothetical protein
MEPLATSVRYDRVGDTIVIEINNGAALTWIEFEDLDAQFTIMSLLMGVYGGKQWMAEHGQPGGMAQSEAKASAARENGRKGGRPRKKRTTA